MKGLAQSQSLPEGFVGGRQVPSKEFEVVPCLKQVLDRRTSVRSFGTLAVERIVQVCTAVEAVGSLVEGIVVVGHP
jgi:hypothetical protein